MTTKSDARLVPGKGCFKRIKSYVVDYVEKTRHTMFPAATGKMETALKETLDELETAVGARIDRVVLLVKDAYSALLSSQNLCKTLSTVREDIRSLLVQVDERFEQMLRREDPTTNASVAIQQESRSETPDSDVETPAAARSDYAPSVNLVSMATEPSK